MAFIVTICFGMVNGIGIHIANFAGEGSRFKAEKISNIGLIMITIFSIIVTILILVRKEEIMKGYS